jgi:hypothetical protein
LQVAPEMGNYQNSERLRDVPGLVNRS